MVRAMRIRALDNEPEPLRRADVAVLEHVVEGEQVTGDLRGPIGPRPMLLLKVYA